MSDQIGFLLMAFFMGSFVFFLMYTQKEGKEYKFRKFLVSETSLLSFFVVSMGLLVPVAIFGPNNPVTSLSLLVGAFTSSFGLSAGGVFLFKKYVYSAYLEETKGDVKDVGSLEERIKKMKERNSNGN